MEVLFSDPFKKSVKKHASIKKQIQKKVDMIMENPIPLGEPLKGNLRGYYSCPVRKNFLIIYLYCNFILPGAQTGTNRNIFNFCPISI